jgi:hypothetical protein
MPIYVYLPLQQETPCDGAAVSEAHREESMRVQDSCVRQVQQIDPVERVLVGFQVNSSIPLFDRK